MLMRQFVKEIHNNVYNLTRRKQVHDVTNSLIDIDYH